MHQISIVIFSVLLLLAISAALGIHSNKTKTDSLTMIAVGDNLLHGNLMDSVKDNKTNKYNFTSIYHPVQKLVKKADIAFINQEAPISSSNEPSGYPSFNSPQDAGRDLIATGFNVINQANNHSLDKGTRAVEETIDFWNNNKNVTMIGMYKDTLDRQRLRIIEKNNIKVGFLSYTYKPHYVDIPENNPDMIPFINKEIMAEEIKTIREHCDVLVVSMHWGNEYESTPNKEQISLAQYLSENGVDIIIGHHPHVIQKAEWITTSNNKKTFCAYSLGNFVSSQRDLDTMLGGMMRLKITKNNNGEILIENAGITPLIMHYESGFKNYKIYPLEKYPKLLDKKHYIYVQKLTFNTLYYKILSKKILGEFYLP